VTEAFIVVGAGGHGRVVADLVRAAGFEIAGFVDADPALAGTAVGGVPVLGDDNYLGGVDPTRIVLANGIGSTGDATIRRRAFERLAAAGFAFPPLVHPRAVVAENVVLEPGAQIMAGAVVQTGSRIGTNAVVNTGAAVDHDCVVGAHGHISPGAVLCGGVETGEAAHVGAGAVVIQGRRIGAGAIVGAGAVVIGDVAAATKVVGVPAGQRNGRT
jgi:UDP-perosamine 4-acetyltransferase